LKPNTLFFFFSTNSWYIDTYPKNLILEAMQVLLGAATLFFCCYRVAAFGFQDLGFKTSIFGSQDLGFKTSTGRRYRTPKALHPTVVLSFSRHFSLRPPSLFSTSTVTFLCVQWSQTDRQTDRRTQQATLYIRLSFWLFKKIPKKNIAWHVNWIH
jgi:hypothetical protein